MKKHLKYDNAKEFKHGTTTPASGAENQCDVQTEFVDERLNPFGEPPMGWMPKEKIMSLVRKVHLEAKAKNSAGR